MIAPPEPAVAKNCRLRHVPVYRARFSEFPCANMRRPEPFKADMALLSELRYPTRWYSKLIAAVLALSFFTFVAAAIISGFVLDNIVMSRTGSQPIGLTNFP